MCLLSVGTGDSGIYIRLDDGRVARLDKRRLKWETFEPLDPSGKPPVHAGDEVLVECSSGTLRGTLIEDVGAEVNLRLPIGSDLKLPTSDVSEFFLLFRARDLKPGDRVILKSRSGNEYRGHVRNLVAGRRLVMTLNNGGEASLRLSKIDLSSIMVPIPIPLESLAIAG
ncbi:MAG: hypothetical protein R3F62_08490 [Planctomycetota bacterium]